MYKVVYVNTCWGSRRELCCCCCSCGCIPWTCCWPCCTLFLEPSLTTSTNGAKLLWARAENVKRHPGKHKSG